MKPWSNSDVPGSITSIPEKRLLAAVLQRAVTDCVSGDGEIQEGARSWLFDDDDCDSPITFSFVCEALDVDTETVRASVILQLRQYLQETGKQTPVNLKSYTEVYARRFTSSAAITKVITTINEAYMS